MKENNKTKRKYTIPSIRVIHTEISSMICGSGNVLPDANNSTHMSDSWDNITKHEGNSIFFGDADNRTEDEEDDY